MGSNFSIAYRINATKVDKNIATGFEYYKVQKLKICK